MCIRDRLKALELPEGASVIDVGTGAGFPSVPAKMVRDDLRLTLLDGLPPGCFLCPGMESGVLPVSYTHL